LRFETADEGGEFSLSQLQVPGARYCRLSPPPIGPPCRHAIEILARRDLFWSAPPIDIYMLAAPARWEYAKSERRIAPNALVDWKSLLHGLVAFFIIAALKIHDSGKKDLKQENF
jgi:hypothetical protein